MIRFAITLFAALALAACGAEAPPEAAPAEAKKVEAAPAAAEAAPAATKAKAAPAAAEAKAAPAAAEAKAHAKACACGAGKAGGTVWCDACASGYIKGEKSKDKAAVTAALASAKPAPAAK
jgi:hypothetical protein